ncbi:hypothetical protein C8A05DRAFT_48494 [Staphylotrichum tortipilum]|uniref:Uncharacterized protein n=1 Tax=Staphylotrichum tortipilum TaxID=2831512 RepID=A0AAN6RMQ8_9PEZI|nr:hypothetical protein C8A05DRAFT_48494 [Staphylotrichum longicolle]
MPQFRALSHSLLESVSSSTCRLMYDLQPRFDLSTVRDRMSTMAKGYSFVAEPANHLADAFLALSELLSKALQQLTKSTVSQAFGTHVYRQLSIAITEKHVRQIKNPFNRHDDRTKSADISVAFAWQSGHRPMERGTTYGLDGAFPASLQPSLLQLYKWASSEWHRFLQLERLEQPKSAPLPDRIAQPRACPQLNLDFPRSDKGRTYHRSTSCLPSYPRSRSRSAASTAAL